MRVQVYNHMQGLSFHITQLVYHTTLPLTGTLLANAYSILLHIKGKKQSETLSNARKDLVILRWYMSVVFDQIWIWYSE